MRAQVQTGTVGSRRFSSGRRTFIGEMRTRAESPVATRHFARAGLGTSAPRTLARARYFGKGSMNSRVCLPTGGPGSASSRLAATRVRKERTVDRATRCNTARSS